MLKMPKIVCLVEHEIIFIISGPGPSKKCVNNTTLLSLLNDTRIHDNKQEFHGTIDTWFNCHVQYKALQCLLCRSYLRLKDNLY